MSSRENPPSPAPSSRSRARTCPSSTYTIAGYPYYLLPAINSCGITSDLSGANVYVLFPLAHGISEIDSYRSALDIQSLLVTSSSAYVKTDIENSDTLAQEDGDVAGQTAVGMAVSEEVGDDQTRVVWYSTEQFLADEIDYQVGGYNTTLFIDSLSWLASAEDISTGLSSKGYGMSLITVDDASAGMLSAVFVGIVPGIALVAGLMIWRSRKAR